MGKDVDQSVKQAGAIMLKNHCHSFWADREITAAGDSGLINFVIHENDKAVSADSHWFVNKCCLVYPRKHRRVHHRLERASAQSAHGYRKPHNQTRLPAQIPGSQ